MQAKVAWFDRDQALIRQFKTGVSIHSHTSRSKESLAFIGCIIESNHLLRTFIRSQEGGATKNGLQIDFERGYWTPPLSPRSAYELESYQIEKLDLDSMVSLTDHDCIEAPLLLRVIPAMHEAPISLEWTALFQTSKFHLGIHNLPGACAQEWMDELKRCTEAPSTERVCDLLRALHEIPEVLVVFNHPLWNLYGNPESEFAQNLEDFLALNNGCLHAFELNGLRRWEENRRVVQLSRRWRQLFISGGDRHGCEPNANLNLTNTSSFAEWVHELRVERKSQLLFMPQYNDSLVARCYQTFLDAIREYPDHSEGAWHWDQRTFHPGRDGSMQPLNLLWTRVPGFLQITLNLARLAEGTPLFTKLRSYFGQPTSRMPDISGQGEGAR